MPLGRIAGQLGLESEGDLNMGAFASLGTAAIGPDGTLYVTGGGDGILALDDSGGLAQAEAGITTGVTETTCNPGGTVTRAQMVSLLIRALDSAE